MPLVYGSAEYNASNDSDAKRLANEAYTKTPEYAKQQELARKRAEEKAKLAQAGQPAGQLTTVGRAGGGSTGGRGVGDRVVAPSQRVVSPSVGGAGGGTGFGGGGIADFAQGFADAFGSGGFTGAGGPGGAGGFAMPPGGGGGNLTLTAERSPDLDRQQQLFESRLAQLNQQGAKVDENLNFQINQYKERLGEGPTTRSIERAASAIRDQMAGLTSEAERAGAAGGRGPGFQAGAIGEGGQRALAGAAADITLGRQQQLDNLLLGGQNLMSAPGQRELAYDTLGSQFFAQGPYQAQADYGLAEKKLGLDAYLGQGDLGVRQYAAQQQAQGSPMDWFRMLYG